MKKYLLVSVIAALSLVSMFVQADNFDELQRNLGRTLYPSPSVAQIKRYGEYPISPATGIPKIELPLYTIELDGLCIPISISYHASGIKVNDVASPVGLGWVLNAGGLISRDVRGGVDRIYPISSGVSCVKFMNEEDVIDAIKGTQESCNDFRRIIKGSDLEDTESDRYYYSFLGKSGIFRHVFERDNLYDIKTIPFSLLDIDEYVKNHTSGYKITDTDGTQYYFDQEEYCSCSQFGSQQIAWHLTKIVTPNSKDTVIFDYLTHTGASYSVTTGSEYAHTEISNVNGMRWGYLRMELAQNSTLYEPYLNGWDLNFRNEFMADVVNYDTPLLKTIRWRGHSVEFVYSEDRTDHLFGNNPLARLKYMTVKSGESDTIKVVSFDNNSYLGSFDRSRRMLLAGINIGNCESSQVEKYSFSYDLSPLPNYNDFQKYGTDIRCHEDFWGYYNGSDSKSFLHADFSFYNNISSLPSRTPNERYAKCGILIGISYPTGGKTEFEYEGNEIDYTPYVNGSTRESYGGLRVKSIKNYEGNKLLNTVEYDYCHSGVASVDISERMFRYQDDYILSFSCPGDCLNLPWTTEFDKELHDIHVSSSLLPANGINSFPIFYTHVIKKTFDANSILIQTVESVYKKDEYNIEDEDNPEYPRFYSKLTNCDEGNVRPLLVSEKITDYSNNSILLTEYEYEIDEKPSFCAGVRLQKEDVEVPLGEVPVRSDFFPYESRNDFCRSLHYHNVIGAPSYRRIKTKKITSNGYSKKESYVYDNQDRTLKPKQIYLTNDGGDSILYIYKFPFDYSDALCSEMMSINMRDVIVDEVTKYNRNQVSEVRYSFLKTNGMILPSAIFKSVGENQASEKTRITDYDEYGNIIGFVSGSEHVAIIWGYRHSYPIAIIRGCSRSDLERRIEPHLLKSISMKSVPTDTDIELIRNAAEICHALVTIYTYKPLVGMTSSTTPNSHTTTYTYDSLNRLSSINSPFGILQKFYYNYKNR